MQLRKILATALGVERCVVENVSAERDALVFAVRAKSGERGKCSWCGRRCPKYDTGSGTRRWRATDIGRTPVWIEAAAPRVKCSEHGVVVERVPWARRGSTFTRAFEDVVGWATKQMSKVAVAGLMRVAWETVGAIVERVVTDAKKGKDLLDGLLKIGIDEVSFRKGHKYLTVVVDHGSGRLVWAREGRDKATLRAFFDELGDERRRKLTHVSADAAAWIGEVVKERCPEAVLCIDPFHVVAWCTEALDEVRRGIWNKSRKAGEKDTASLVKGARYALLKNPENLTERQQAKLSSIEVFNRPLYRGYLLKEELRLVFSLKGTEGIELLDRWLSWAQRSRLLPFVKLARSIRRHRKGIDAALLHGLSNGRVEATNNQVRLLTRIAHGFRKASALISLMFLKLAGLPINLPTQPSLS